MPGQRPATPAEPTATTTPPALTQSFDRYPSKFDISQVPEGVNVMTPYGPMDRSGNIQFTPDGEVKYREAVVQRRKDFGPHPWAGDPNAPKPPARMGGWMINPFTGQWRR